MNYFDITREKLHDLSFGSVQDDIDLAVEASTLELKAGEWPDRIIVTEPTGTFTVFVRSQASDENGNFIYRAPAEKLLILND